MNKYEWNLNYLLKDDQEFEEKLSLLKKEVEQLATFKGTLDKEEKMVEYFNLQLKFVDDIGPVYMYAHLGSDLDKKNMANAAKQQKCMMLFNNYSIATSFEQPELLSIGEEKIYKVLDSNKNLGQFKFYIEDLFRKQSHVLDLKSEELLSTMSPALRKGGELYSALSVADLKAPKIKLNGKEVTVTQGNWSSLITDAKDAKDRKKIFEALYKHFEENKTTYATIYEGILQTNKANAKVKGFKNILESYLFRNNIPTSVYTTLVDVASKKNASLKKYIKLRRKYLGLKSYHTYDRFQELATSNKKYTFDEAKELFFASIEKCPQDFKDKAREVLKEGYVDVYEKEGKRSGAYSSSMANCHPYILLNYTDTLDDVFTVAHESGHSIHSLYSMEAQPTMLQDYTIFVAEIASTFNEHMLLDYLMERGDLDIDDKIKLLQKAIDSITSTFYRQTLFAHYELLANRLVEEEKVVNYEVLSSIMIDLYKKYYGLDIKKERVKEYVWCYIPHLFYTPFYVYQYATSFSASFALYKNVKEGKKGAFENYIKLLKAGGSKYPIDEAKDAGIDFTKKETFLAVVERMDDLVNKLEKLLEERENKKR